MSEEAATSSTISKTETFKPPYSLKKNLANAGFGLHKIFNEYGGLIKHREKSCAFLLSALEHFQRCTTNNDVHAYYRLLFTLKTYLNAIIKSKSNNKNEKFSYAIITYLACEFGIQVTVVDKRNFADLSQQLSKKLDKTLEHYNKGFFTNNQAVFTALEDFLALPLQREHQAAGKNIRRNKSKIDEAFKLARFVSQATTAEHFVFIFQHIANTTIPTSRASGVSKKSRDLEVNASALRSALLKEVVVSEHSPITFTANQLLLIAKTLVKENQTSPDIAKLIQLMSNGNELDKELINVARTYLINTFNYNNKAQWQRFSEQEHLNRHANAVRAVIDVLKSNNINTDEFKQYSLRVKDLQTEKEKEANSADVATKSDDNDSSKSDAIAAADSSNEEDGKASRIDIRNSPNSDNDNDNDNDSGDVHAHQKEQELELSEEDQFDVSTFTREFNTLLSLIDDDNFHLIEELYRIFENLVELINTAFFKKFNSPLAADSLLPITIKTIFYSKIKAEHLPHLWLIISYYESSQSQDGYTATILYTSLLRAYGSIMVLGDADKPQSLDDYAKFLFERADDIAKNAAEMQTLAHKPSESAMRQYGNALSHYSHLKLTNDMSGDLLCRVQPYALQSKADKTRFRSFELLFGDGTSENIGLIRKLKNPDNKSRAVIHMLVLIFVYLQAIRSHHINMSRRKRYDPTKWVYSSRGKKSTRLLLAAYADLFQLKYQSEEKEFKFDTIHRMTHGKSQRIKIAAIKDIEDLFDNLLWHIKNITQFIDKDYCTALDSKIKLLSDYFELPVALEYQFGHDTKDLDKYFSVLEAIVLADTTADFIKVQTGVLTTAKQSDNEDLKLWAIDLDNDITAMIQLDDSFDAKRTAAAIDQSLASIPYTKEQLLSVYGNTNNLYSKFMRAYKFIQHLEHCHRKKDEATLFKVRLVRDIYEFKIEYDTANFISAVSKYLNELFHDIFNALNGKDDFPKFFHRFAFVANLRLTIFMDRYPTVSYDSVELIAIDKIDYSKVQLSKDEKKQYRETLANMQKLTSGIDHPARQQCAKIIYGLRFDKVNIRHIETDINYQCLDAYVRGHYGNDTKDFNVAQHVQNLMLSIPHNSPSYKALAYYHNELTATKRVTVDDTVNSTVVVAASSSVSNLMTAVAETNGTSSSSCAPQLITSPTQQGHQ